MRRVWFRLKAELHAVELHAIESPPEFEYDADDDNLNLEYMILPSSLGRY